jgi:hypothetical protein
MPPINMASESILAQIDNIVFSILSIKYPEPIAMNMLPNFGSNGYGIVKYFWQRKYPKTTILAYAISVV